MTVRVCSFVHRVHTWRSREASSYKLPFSNKSRSSGTCPIWLKPVRIERARSALSIHAGFSQIGHVFQKIEPPDSLKPATLLVRIRTHEFCLDTLSCLYYFGPRLARHKFDIFLPGFVKYPSHFEVFQTVEAHSEQDNRNVFSACSTTTGIHR